MKSLFSILFRVLVSIGVAGLCAVGIIILYTNAQLPDASYLEDIQLQVPLKIYTADGKLIGEYGEKRRTPISIEEVPNTLKNAILATEDRRFYEHKGVDLRGLIRAGVKLMVSGTKSQGASTITMQVARNFFLTRKKTFGRKLNEILLAIKIEKEFTKDQILELYLNKIYFGKRAYGVQAAAQVYYGMTADKLTLAQMAMIAGLPQAPSAINPINNADAARKRRTHVLKRMLHYGFINEIEFEQANAAPVLTHYHGRIVELDAPHVAEMARRELVERFGPQVYTLGYVAYTTVDSRLQTMAHHAVQEGLLQYDKRHGYRGPIAKLPTPSHTEIDIDAWTEQLKGYPKSEFTLPAAVISVTPETATVILPNKQKVNIPFESMKWAQRQYSPTRLGPFPHTVNDVVSTGDVIYIEPGKKHWEFSQLPEVEGALVALHPKNGALLAMVGGFDFNLSHFNRAIQGTRQPGSNFKPFIYAAALEKGFTAASIINDAPVVYKDDTMDSAWRPQNHTKRFYGPTRLRIGLVKSRNLVSIRLLQALGIKRAIRIIEKFGFPKDKLPEGLSLALGTSIASPLDIATGYASFANGGYKVKPYIIQRVTDDQDNLIYVATPPKICPECTKLVEHDIDPYPQNENLIDQMVKQIEWQERPKTAEQIISPQTAYIMTSLLQDAVQTGTARRAKALKRTDLAGKTGTTQNQMDAWFTGFNQSIIATAWVGYDEPRSLEEYGSQVALPIWMKFMGPALKGVPETKMEQPRGLVTVKIDPRTGLLARPGQRNAIFEIFKQGTVPRRSAHYSENEFSEPTPSPSGWDYRGESLF